jgi:NitT/TauT family transport system substrate-binding protein
MKKYLITAGLLITTTLFATQLTTRAASGPEVKELRIGYLPNIVLPQPLLGLENGEYAKYMPGIAFKGTAYAAGPAVLEALRAGIIDIGYTGPFPPMNAYFKAKDVVLLAAAAKGGTQLMVSKSGNIKTVADLKGKVIGVNQIGSTVDVMVRFNLVKAGLVPDRDVRIVEVPPAEQADALKRNEVAAVAAPAPWPSYVAKQGNGRPLLNWRAIFDDGNYLQGVAFTSRKFLEANPNLVAQFVKTHRAITDNLVKNREKGNAAVVAAWSKITKKVLEPEIAKAAFSTISFTNVANEKDFQRLAEATYKAGIIREIGSFEGFFYKPAGQ